MVIEDVGVVSNATSVPTHLEENTAIFMYLHVITVVDQMRMQKTQRIQTAHVPATSSVGENVRTQIANQDGMVKIVTSMFLTVDA